MELHSPKASLDHALLFEGQAVNICLCLALDRTPLSKAPFSLPSIVSYFAVLGSRSSPCIGSHFAHQASVALCGSSSSEGHAFGPEVLPPRIGVKAKHREAETSPSEVLPPRAGLLRRPLSLPSIGQTSLSKGFPPRPPVVHISLCKDPCPCLAPGSYCTTQRPLPPRLALDRPSL